MPSNDLQRLALAKALSGGLANLGASTNQAYDAQQQQRTQDFDVLGEQAGQPVTSAPATGGGLFANLLRGAGILPSTTAATPIDIARQQQAIEDREFQKLMLISTVAGKINPQGLAALSQSPSFKAALGGVDPSILKQFIVPMDATMMNQQNMVDYRRQSLEEKTQHDQDMLQFRQQQEEDRRQAQAEAAEGRAERLTLMQSLGANTQEFRQAQINEQETRTIEGMINNRIKTFSSGLTPRQDAVAYWNSVSDKFYDYLGQGYRPRDAIGIAQRAARQEMQTAASAPASSGPSFLGSLKGMFGGGLGNSPTEAAPTSTGTVPPPSSPSLPKLPW